MVHIVTAGHVGEEFIPAIPKDWLRTHRWLAGRFIKFCKYI